MMFELLFSKSEESCVDRHLIESRIERFIDALDLDGNFSLTFVSDCEIRELNRTYRKKDEATDVLTFRYQDEDVFSQNIFTQELGDIFISSECVRRNAEAFSTPFLEEVTRVLLHGMMHLLGYDHSTNDFSTEEMLIKQEQILSSLGYKS